VLENKKPAQGSWIETSGCDKRQVVRHAGAYGWFMTTPPPNSEGQVPTSSSKNRYATNRTVQIAVALIVVILLIAFVPW
jgi:hypothetical protein